MSTDYSTVTKYCFHCRYAHSLPECDPGWWELVGRSAYRLADGSLCVARGAVTTFGGRSYFHSYVHVEGCEWPDWADIEF